MSAVRFLSICSGIEAASQAWAPLGWQAVGFSEIDPFACAVLAHHHPQVPNFGSLTDFRQWPVGALAQADVLVGGTPCQAFSVAGLRQSLADERGNLTLTLVHLYDHLTKIRHTAGRPAPVLVWENVPGVLNTPDNAFGCFLGGLAGEDGPLRPPGGKWHDAGYVRGPKRTISWRVLDAQYQGLAQRRRRVFLVAGSRDGFCAEQVLFEFTGLRRDTPPRREAGEGTAPTLAARTRGGGGLGTDAECDGAECDGAECDGAECDGAECDGAECDGAECDGAVIAETLRGQAQSSQQAGAGGSKFGSGRHNQDTFIPEVCGSATNVEAESGQLIPIAFQERGRAGGPNLEYQEDLAYSLNAPNGGGRRQELNIVQPLPFDTTQITSKTNRSQPQAGDPCHPLASGAHPPAIAFSARARGDDGRGYDRPEQVFGEVVGTIDTMKPHNVAICDVAPTLREHSRNNSNPATECSMHVLSGTSAAYAVRRLTPRECERLQGFPDDYTAIPWRGKPADLCPDGPRYKALGNSMAVPVMRWIGARLCAYLCQ